MEIWWDPRASGKMGSKGSDRDHWKVGNRKINSRYLDTYDSSPPVSGPPYGNVDQWSYFNGRNWVKPVGEIFVKCAAFTTTTTTTTTTTRTTTATTTGNRILNTAPCSNHLYLIFD